MKHGREGSKALIAILALFLVLGPAFGQGGHGRGRLAGTVSDGEGHPVAGARVVLRLVEPGEARFRRLDSIQRGDSAVFETQTDGRGAWSYNGLASGSWEIQVSKGETFDSCVQQVQVRPMSVSPPIRTCLNRIRTGAYSLDPGLLEAANAHYAKKEYAEALTAYRGYLEKDPDAILVVLAVGVCLSEMGRVDEAVKTFQDSVDRTSVAPGDKELWARACAGLAESCFKRGDRDRALEYWQKAAKNSDWSEIPARNAAEVLFAGGQAAEALEYYLIAARIAPQQAEIHYKLGLVYLRLGDRPSAETSFAEVVKLEPRTALGRQAKMRLADLAKRRSGRP